MPSLVEENKRRILIGNLHLQYFLYGSSPVDNQIPEVSGWDLRQYLTRAESCYKRVGNPTADTPPVYEEFSQIDIKELFFLHEIKIVGDYAVFLFSSVNSRGADQAYRDKRSREIRLNPKREGEGVDHSAHFVVKMTGRNGLYPACFEEMPGLPIGIINRLFSKLNEAVHKYYTDELLCNDPGGSTTKKKFRTQVVFGTLPSEKFWDTLASKKALCSLMLRSETSEFFDERSALKIRRNDLYLAKPSDQFFHNPQVGVNDICGTGKLKGFGKLFVTIKDEEKRQKVVAINCDTLTQKTRSYVKSQTVKFTKKLTTGYEHIDDDVSAKMIAILQ